MLDQIATTRRILVERENMVNRLVEETRKCTIAVQFNSNSILVSWSLGDQMPTDKDWIGFYIKENPNKSYREYFTTGGQRQGNRFIRTPKTPGLYDFRFFPNGTYNPIARSDTVYIGPELNLNAHFNENTTEINITWELTRGELTNGDWIGLYKVDSDNKKYIKSIPISGTNERTVAIDAHLEPGPYEIRFFPYKCGYTSVKKK